MVHPEAHFLHMLFSELNNELIDYAVMRNYASLPVSTGGSDLDILIDPEHEAQFRSTLARVIKQSGGVMIGEVNTVDLYKGFAFGKPLGEDTDWWGVRLDISIGMSYAGVAPILTREALKDCSIEYKEVSVLVPELASIIGVLKELLHNKILPDRYLIRAREAIRSECSMIERTLTPIGIDNIELFKTLCLEGADANEIASKSSQIRRSILSNAFRRNPLRYLKKRSFYIYSRVERIIRPPGKVVAILGVDGAGKSTLIEALKPVIQRATHGALVVEHLRPNLLPALSRAKGIAAEEPKIGVDPHGKSAPGFLGSIMRVSYYLLDYTIGYWCKVRPIIAKSPTIFLFDGYAYDFLIDPQRFRLNLPEWLLRLVVSVVPTPDLIICLLGDSAVIARRKEELSEEEVQRQVDALTVFAGRNAQAQLVSTTGSTESSRDETLMHLKMICKG